MERNEELITKFLDLFPSACVGHILDGNKINTYRMERTENVNTQVVNKFFTIENTSNYLQTRRISQVITQGQDSRNGQAMLILVYYL